MRNQLLILLGCSCKWWVTFLLLLSKFFVFWPFVYQMLRCRYHRIYPESSLSFVDIQTNVFLQIFGYYFFKIYWNFYLFTFSSVLETLIMLVLVYLMLSHRSLRLSSFSSFTFILIPQDGYQLTFLQVLWFFLLPTEICWWVCLVYFSFQ